MLCGIAGAIITSRLNSAQPTAGAGYELDAIAAVVLGGTSLAGGRGHIVGTLIGALIIGTLNNGLNILDVFQFLSTSCKRYCHFIGGSLQTARKPRRFL